METALWCSGDTDRNAQTELEIQEHRGQGGEVGEQRDGWAVLGSFFPFSSNVKTKLDP